MEIDKKFIMTGAVCASAMLMNLSYAHANSIILTVTSVALNLREQPDKTSETVCYLPKGAKLEVIEKNGEWYQVKYKNYTGYVKQDFVEEYIQSQDTSIEDNSSDETTPAVANIEQYDVAEASYSQTGTTKIAKCNLNLRTGPATSYPVARIVYGGASVTYFGESNGWAKIKYNGTTGYVSSSYLDSQSSNTGSNNSDSSDKESQSTSSTTKYVNTTALNIRSGPANTYPIIGGLYYGASVTVHSQSNGWAKISYNGKTGYVNSQYVSSSIVVDNSNDISTATITKYVNTTALNVRSGPANTYNIVGGLTKGQSVKVQSISNGWAKIIYKEKTAYVNAIYLADSVGGSSDKTESSSKYVNVDLLNVRSGPGTNYSKIGTLKNATKVTVYSVENGWAKISYNGKEAYVYDEYLSSSIVQQAPSGATTKYVNISSLNVRSGPGTDYSKVGVVYYGISLDVKSVENGWAKISYNGKEAYVSDSYLTTQKPSDMPQATSKDASALIAYAKKFLGVPYVWGANGPSSFDCSGFTCYVYRNQAGITLPRHSSVQSLYGTYVSRANLMPGDLVFFDTKGENNGVVSHVGIYIGDGKMIHASYTLGKIVIVDFNSSYFQRTFVNGRRVL